MLINAKAGDAVSASIIRNTNPEDSVLANGIFKVQCFDKDGNLKWETESPNLAVNQGRQDMNTKYFTGVGYTAGWFIGLITGPTAATIAATDTLASKAWTEFTDYTGNRKSATFGTATTANPSVISNTASPAAFSIIAPGGDVVGAFLCAAATGSPTLFSAANFSGGNRTVANGDTLNVTYTFSLQG